MRRIALDFATARRSRASWLVLGLAVFAVADFAHTFIALSDEIAAAEARAATSRPRPRDAALADRRSDDAVVSAFRQADQIVKSLTLPWDSLFVAVEGATDERIALLALQPDPQKGELSISGEAIDYPAILAYLTRLDERSLLRDVHLVRHEVRQDDPQRPLYFRIVASWGREK